MIAIPVCSGTTYLLHGPEVTFTLRVEYETDSPGCWVCRVLENGQQFVSTTEVLRSLPVEETAPVEMAAA